MTFCPRNNARTSIYIFKSFTRFCFLWFSRDISGQAIYRTHQLLTWDHTHAEDGLDRGKGVSQAADGMEKTHSAYVCHTHTLTDRRTTVTHRSQQVSNVLIDNPLIKNKLAACRPCCGPLWMETVCYRHVPLS